MRHLKWKACTKVNKMASLMAWEQRPSGLIKMERSACAFKMGNVSWKQILIINLNCYWVHCSLLNCLVQAATSTDQFIKVYIKVNKRYVGSFIC